MPHHTHIVTDPFQGAQAPLSVDVVLQTVSWGTRPFLTLTVFNARAAFLVYKTCMPPANRRLVSHVGQGGALRFFNAVHCATG